MELRSLLYSEMYNFLVIKKLTQTITMQLIYLVVLNARARHREPYSRGKGKGEGMKAKLVS